MRTIEFFQQLKIPSTLTTPLLDLANTATQWHRHYNFDVVPVDPLLLRTDPVMAFLMSKYAFIGGVSKMPENTCYHWHTDTVRQTSINMLLKDGGDSRCLFTKPTAEVSFPFMELSYLPDTYYVFNTQMPHTVYNFTKPRYLFSLEFFDKDRALTFAELCDALRADYI
jgi:hypothetical protein